MLLLKSVRIPDICDGKVRGYFSWWRKNVKKDSLHWKYKYLELLEWEPSEQSDERLYFYTSSHLFAASVIIQSETSLRCLPAISSEVLSTIGNRRILLKISYCFHLPEIPYHFLVYLHFAIWTILFESFSEWCSSSIWRRPLPKVARHKKGSPVRANVVVDCSSESTWILAFEHEELERQPIHVSSVSTSYR